MGDVYSNLENVLRRPSKGTLLNCSTICKRVYSIHSPQTVTQKFSFIHETEEGQRQANTKDKAFGKEMDEETVKWVVICY